ncbi:MAG: C39 family peptidase [Myxococcota bacterium]
MLPLDLTSGMDRLRVEMLPQPDDVTCGPTCLHALYRYYAMDISLTQVVQEIPQLEGGGTLAVLLGCHALKNGFSAQIYTYNLQMFDPTWWAPGPSPLRERLLAQLAFKQGRKKLQVGTEAYVEFLDLGGRVNFEDLTPALIRRHLVKGHPIITGLSATYLYRTAREYGPGDEYDDVRGEPSGHFVLLCGYDRAKRNVLVADPLLENPISADLYYEVNIDRLVGSILLGILTYDANLLIISPRDRSKDLPSHVHSRRRQ